MCHPDVSSRSAIVVDLLKVIVILPASMIIGSLTAADATAKTINPPQPTKLEETATGQQKDASFSTATPVVTPTLATATSGRPQTASTSYQVIFDSADGSNVDSQTIAEGT